MRHLAILVFLCIGGATSAQQLIGITFDGDVISVDRSTGAATFVRQLGFSNCKGLAFDGTDFYTGAGAKLIRFDPFSSFTQNIGSVGAVIESLSFSPDGTLFAGIDVNGGSSAQTVARVNKATGTLIDSRVPMNGFNDLNGMSFDGAGNLFLMNLSGPRQIGQYSYGSNQLSNVHFLTGTLLVGGATYDLVANQEDFLISGFFSIGGGASFLGRLDKSGNLTSLGSMGFNTVTGLAYNRAVPEPGTWAFAAAALVLTRRRRKE